MHKPFDATMKEMVERHPGPWLSLLLGRVVEDIQVINADLSTITAEADKLFRIGGPEPWIAHAEFEASYKSDAPLKGLRYSVLSRCRHGLPVLTFFVLLRPEADGKEFTGVLEEKRPDGTTYLVFRYNVIRVWELPTAELLTGDLATLPLAPISKVSEKDLPDVIHRMEERIEREAAPNEADELRTAAYILLGLNHSAGFIRTLLEEVRTMRESVTVQIFIDEGRVEEARKILLRQGRKRLGDPAPSIEETIGKIDDLDRLETLIDRQFEVSSWEELMAGD